MSVVRRPRERPASLQSAPHAGYSRLRQVLECSTGMMRQSQLPTVLRCSPAEQEAAGGLLALRESEEEEDAANAAVRESEEEEDAANTLASLKNNPCTEWMDAFWFDIYLDAVVARRLTAPSRQGQRVSLLASYPPLLPLVIIEGDFNRGKDAWYFFKQPAETLLNLRKGTAFDQIRSSPDLQRRLTDFLFSRSNTDPQIIKCETAKAASKFLSAQLLGEYNSKQGELFDAVENWHELRQNRKSVVMEHVNMTSVTKLTTRSLPTIGPESALEKRKYELWKVVKLQIELDGELALERATKTDPSKQPSALLLSYGTLINHILVKVAPSNDDLKQDKSMGPLEKFRDRKARLRFFLYVGNFGKGDDTSSADANARTTGDWENDSRSIVEKLYDLKDKRVFSFAHTQSSQILGYPVLVSSGRHLESNFHHFVYVWLPAFLENRLKEDPTVKFERASHTWTPVILDELLESKNLPGHLKQNATLINERTAPHCLYRHGGPTGQIESEDTKQNVVLNLKIQYYSIIAAGRTMAAMVNVSGKDRANSSREESEKMLSKMLDRNDRFGERLFFDGDEYRDLSKYKSLPRDIGSIETQTLLESCYIDSNRKPHVLRTWADAQLAFAYLTRKAHFLDWFVTKGVMKPEDLMTLERPQLRTLSEKVYIDDRENDTKGQKWASANPKEAVNREVNRLFTQLRQSYDSIVNEIKKQIKWTKDPPKANGDGED